MRRSRFGDAGGAGSGRKLAAGYWLGPGGWVYYVSADQSVQVVYNGRTRKFLYKMQDGPAAGAIRNELMIKGRNYGSSSKAAYQAAGLPLTGGVVKSTPGASTPRTSSSVPDSPKVPEPTITEATDTPDYKQYALVAAGVLGALGGLYLLFSSPSRSAP